MYRNFSSDFLEFLFGLNSCTDACMNCSSSVFLHIMNIPIKQLLFHCILFFKFLILYNHTSGQIGTRLCQIIIEKALKMNPDLKHAYEEEEDTKRLIDTSLRLEGLPRHSSTHAAGVVICREPVMEYVPLSANDGQINTQYTMTILEELGLLKMDFLGLRTLTVIQSAVQEIERIHGIRLNMEIGRAHV
mgnify:CR=1 FL=1